MAGRKRPTPKQEHAVVRSAKRIAQNLNIAIGAASEPNPLQRHFLGYLRAFIVGEFVVARRKHALTRGEETHLLLEMMDVECGAHGARPLSERHAKVVASLVRQFWGGMQLGTLDESHLANAAARWNVKKAGRPRSGEHGKYEHLSRALRSIDAVRWRAWTGERLRQEHKEARRNRARNALPLVPRPGDATPRQWERALDRRVTRAKAKYAPQK